jgi:uroporphyrin-III C-methyltransferase/precorrin-2 dehydrogenase/sirohydrochlorin ferrochelatase
MDHLPIFLRVQDRRAVVVGGGAVAARKAELLLKCGAQVLLIAPALLKPGAELLTQSDRVRWVQAEFASEHLAGAALVVAATDSEEVNAAVAKAAQAAGIPVNVVDDPQRSTFIFPAIVDRSPVIVAVGSEGTAPVLARRLREQLEALLPARLGALARFAGLRRRSVQQALRPSLRRPFWERILGGAVAARMLQGDEQAAEEEFNRELSAVRSGATRIAGEVYLIGAGPGDPDLLTLRALQLLQQADVVLYDRLVSPAVLERARREAERIFVGKDAHGYRTPQERIHELLIEKASRGLKVARLKGGDPFMFGRGGEEIQALARHGIPFTVVPGITAGVAAAAAAAIPLTQRELAQSVTFATGHFAEGDTLDWQALARPHQTVVFYMAVGQLAHIAERLMAAGAPAARPAAIVERASLSGERIVRSALGDVATRARAEQIVAPALLIIGEVAALGGASALGSLTETLRGVA